MKGANALRLAPLWWTAGILLAVFIVFESLIPATGMPAAISDKLVHAIGYAVLCLWFAGILDPRRYPVLGALLLMLGILVEVAQGLMALGRTAEWQDVVADFLGIAVALALAYAGLGTWMLRVERALGLT